MGCGSSTEAREPTETTPHERDVPPPPPADYNPPPGQQNHDPQPKPSDNEVKNHDHNKDPDNNIIKDPPRPEPNATPPGGENNNEIKPPSGPEPEKDTADQPEKEKPAVDVHDESKEREKTGEEPKVAQPVGEFDNGMLGLANEGLLDIISRLSGDELFVDSEFPADESSLYYNKTEDLELEWKRPKDIVEAGQAAQLFVDGISRHDIVQGYLSDCWFLSSCSAVSQKSDIMRKVIPGDQTLSGDGYHGVVHFRFWRYGSWVDLYIDDMLPTRFGTPLYAKCSDPNEFWVCLLEKAYSKLHGSFQAIEGGMAMDALIDMTGGLGERILLEKPEAKIYKHLLRAHKSGAFIACSKKGQMSTEADSHGLISGHAYTVTKVMQIRNRKLPKGIEKFVRIRNPWGNEVEWKGAWSDNDSKWKLLDDATKQKMELQAQGDGEWWMSYDDFCRHFQELTICTLGPDFDGDGKSDKAGHIESVSGAWVPGSTAGGCRNDLDKFSTNPQFALTLPEADDFDAERDDPETEGKCSVLIELMQEHRRSQRHLGVKSLNIGFVVYKTDNPEARLPLDHFKYNYDAGSSGSFINLRQVVGRFELDPGHYIVIPSTFMSDQSGTFRIRLFGEKNFSVKGPL